MYIVLVFNLEDILVFFLYVRALYLVYYSSYSAVQLVRLFLNYYYYKPS
jgi:hypothetical protein